ncbi:MAG: DMT family transporter [[Clostridium] innocuum]
MTAALFPICIDAGTAADFNWHGRKWAYLIFVSTLLAYLLQTFAQKFTTANSASLILSMEALFASIFSFLLLGEVMSPQMILGACLIFSSILYIEYKPGRKKKDKQQDIC